MFFTLQRSLLTHLSYPRARVWWHSFCLLCLSLSLYVGLFHMAEVVFDTFVVPESHLRNFTCCTCCGTSRKNCISLQHMRHAALHRITLQHFATLCNTHSTGEGCSETLLPNSHCNTLQHNATLCHSATLCNTLHHTATHCQIHNTG